MLRLSEDNLWWSALVRLRHSDPPHFAPANKKMRKMLRQQVTVEDSA